ncbi:unnamed protein product, partial [Closterium sp. NIES-54]
HDRVRHGGRQDHVLHEEVPPQHVAAYPRPKLWPQPHPLSALALPRHLLHTRQLHPCLLFTPSCSSPLPAAPRLLSARRPSALLVLGSPRADDIPAAASAAAMHGGRHLLRQLLLLPLQELVPPIRLHLPVRALRAPLPRLPAQQRELLFRAVRR